MSQYQYHIRLTKSCLDSFPPHESLSAVAPFTPVTSWSSPIAPLWSFWIDLASPAGLTRFCGGIAPLAAQVASVFTPLPGSKCSYRACRFLTACRCAILCPSEWLISSSSPLLINCYRLLSSLLANAASKDWNGSSAQDHSTRQSVSFPPPLTSWRSTWSPAIHARIANAQVYPFEELKIVIGVHYQCLSSRYPPS